MTLHKNTQIWAAVPGHATVTYFAEIVESKMILKTTLPHIILF